MVDVRNAHGHCKTLGQNGSFLKFLVACESPQPRDTGAVVAGRVFLSARYN